MSERTGRTMVLMALVTAMLLCVTVQPVMAWGGLTHYSINREAGRNSTEELSAAVAPDVLHDFPYGSSGLGAFVHEELPEVLYGPLGFFLCNVSVNESQERWATGWMTHTTADRSAHGTYLEGSPYLGDNNYISAVGADTQLEHIVAEFGGDILAYWLHEGTMPECTVVYPDQVSASFSEYDSYCGTWHSEEYDSDRYLEAFESFLAMTWVEQVVIDIRQDKRLQFTDWAYLVWAWRNYHEPYSRYYQCAIDNVTGVNCSQTVPQCILSDISICGQIYEQSTDGPGVSPVMSKVHQTEYTKIKVDVGRQLIDEGLMKPHREFDAKTGAVTISFEQTVSDRKLVSAYKRHLEETYKKRTGKQAKFLDDSISRRKPVTVSDVKEDYPELYRKLIEKGVIPENQVDREKVHKHR